MVYIVGYDGIYRTDICFCIHWGMMAYILEI